eukprot:COSAG04_NODE_3759_length_2552_cov_2.606925_3_plen_36_part_00
MTKTTIDTRSGSFILLPPEPGQCIVTHGHAHGARE